METPIDIEQARSFWRCAAGFPADKEVVYPEHAVAQEFERWRGKLVLEYGCGGGSDALSYLRRGNSVWACDIVPENVAQTMMRAVAHKLEARLRPVLLTEPTKIAAVADGEADVASSHGVLHHVRDPMPVLLELRRALALNGTFYVMLYTEHLWAHHLADVMRLMAQRGVDANVAFGWMTDGEGCPWAERYTEESGAKLLAEAGFVVDSTHLYHSGFFRTFRCKKG